MLCITPLLPLLVLDYMATAVQWAAATTKGSCLLPKVPCLSLLYTSLLYSTQVYIPTRPRPSALALAHYLPAPISTCTQSIPALCLDYAIMHRLVGPIVGCSLVLVHHSSALSTPGPLLLSCCGHTTMKAPDPISTRKLSMVGPD